MIRSDNGAVDLSGEAAHNIRNLLLNTPFGLAHSVGADFLIDKVFSFDSTASRTLADRFQESCQMGGFIRRVPVYAVEGLETEDLAIWLRGGGRLNYRSEMRIWRS